MSRAVQEAILARYGAHVVETHSHLGDDTVVLRREGLLDVCRYLKHDADMRFDMPVDVTAVDLLEYPGHSGPRFVVVYHFYSTALKHRIRLRVPLEEDDCRVPSLTSLWRGVNWFEREAWDMFGVRFEGHPDLKRILLYEEFEGHPLRKDYPLRGYQPLIPIAHLAGDAEDPKMREVDLNYIPHFEGSKS